VVVIVALLGALLVVATPASVWQPTAGGLVARILLRLPIEALIVSKLSRPMG
jgi:hypothetical protein